MGFDIYGADPGTEEGKYFRNNVWWWRPLANYCLEVAPDVTEACPHWHSNDGAGLNAEDALALADALQAELDAGRTETYARRYASRLEAMPNEPCTICEATGVRKEPPETGAGDLMNGGVECNACDGEGYCRPFVTHYPFDVDNVREFVTFLRGCGGFSIC